MFCNTLYKALCDDGSQFFVIQLDDGVCVIESCRKPIVQQHIKLLLGLAFSRDNLGVSDSIVLIQCQLRTEIGCCLNPFFSLLLFCIAFQLVCS